MKKIVVTGALGHIGSRLIRSISNTFKDSSTILVDNLSTQRYNSLFNLPQGHYEFIEADVRRVDLVTVISDALAVVHLAAVADPGASERVIRNSNFPATFAVARACADTHTRMIFVSSTSVYGKNGKLDPKTPYAISKLKEEQMIINLGKAKKLSYSIVRFGTICGISPGIRFHTAVNKFCLQSACGIPLSVWESARNQTRPYLDLSEAVEAILFLINHPECDLDIYNIITQNLTIEKILSLISIYRPHVKVEYVKDKCLNPSSILISDEKIRQKGFIYKGNISTCIKETLNLLQNLDET